MTKFRREIVMSMNQTLRKQCQVEFSKKFVGFMKRDIWVTIMRGNFIFFLPCIFV